MNKNVEQIRDPYAEAECMWKRFVHLCHMSSWRGYLNYEEGREWGALEAYLNRHMSARPVPAELKSTEPESGAAGEASRCCHDDLAAPEASGVTPARRDPDNAGGAAAGVEVGAA